MPKVPDEEPSSSIYHMLYLVVKRDGTLHKPPRVYDTLAKARNKCTEHGDSIVELPVDLGKEPAYIRGGFEPFEAAKWRTK